MLYFSILVPLPAECSESVPSCNVSFAYTLTKIQVFRNYLIRILFPAAYKIFARILFGTFSLPFPLPRSISGLLLP